MRLDKDFTATNSLLLNRIAINLIYHYEKCNYFNILLDYLKNLYIILYDKKFMQEIGAMNKLAIFMLMIATFILFSFNNSFSEQPEEKYYEYNKVEHRLFKNPVDEDVIKDKDTGTIVKEKFTRRPETKEDYETFTVSDRYYYSDNVETRLLKKPVDEEVLAKSQKGNVKDPYLGSTARYSGKVKTMKYTPYFRYERVENRLFKEPVPELDIDRMGKPVKDEE